MKTIQHVRHPGIDTNLIHPRKAVAPLGMPAVPRGAGEFPGCVEPNMPDSVEEDLVTSPHFRRLVLAGRPRQDREVLKVGANCPIRFDEPWRIRCPEGLQPMLRHEPRVKGS